MTAPTCPSCHDPMIFVSKSTCTGKRKNKFGAYRFRCPVCEFEETIHGNGDIDLLLIPEQALNAVKSMFREEEDARYGTRA